MPCTLVCSSCCLRCRPIRVHGQFCSHRSPGSTEDGKPVAKLRSVLFTAANKSTLTLPVWLLSISCKASPPCKCLAKGTLHGGGGGEGGQPDCMQTSRSLPVVAVYICFRTDSKPGSTAEHAAMQGKLKCSTKCQNAQPQDTASSTVKDLVR